MVFSFKKYSVLVILFFLLGGFVKIVGQSMEPPNIHCVIVDSVGDVTITYTNNHLNGYWQSYTVDTSTSQHLNWSSVGNITNGSNTSYTIPGTSANSNQVYYTMITNTSGNPLPTSDTVSTIFLSVTNLGGIAELRWNAISIPLPDSSSHKYKIWREYPKYVWTQIATVIDSTDYRMVYNDTITFCNSTTLTYRVEISDSSGCTSVSNRDSASSFSEVYLPAQATMDTVSVSPVNNDITITWQKSTKQNVIGYLIYRLISGAPCCGVWDSLTTVYGINKTSYTYTLANPSDSIVSFYVQLLDSCGKTGPHSNYQSTMLLKDKPDPCNEINTLTWNGYKNLDGSVNSNGIGGYKIWARINGGPYQLLGTTGPHITTYIDSNLSTPETRRYYVMVYDSANNAVTASSNRLTYNVQTAKMPAHNYLRTASVILNSTAIDVVGYIDSSCGAEYYVIQRSTSDTGGGYSPVTAINAPRHSDSINYIDNSANADARSYHYIIIAQDSCNHNLDTSNLGQTMYLTASGQPDRINTLTWNDYSNWLASPSNYNIYRSEDGINYSLLSTVPYTNAGQNIYYDNVNIVTQGQGIFYYYIMATESPNNTYPFIDTSYSNIAEAYQDPLVFIPDAFNPKGVNRIFIPVGVFINVTGYDFMIIDRWGSILFESKDPTIGWDGTYKSGRLVEEGVYVYILTYTSSKGEYFQRTGTVTLLK